jgi:hypothetical protein
MFQVSPVTTYRIAVNGTNVVVSSYHRAGEALEHDAESSRRNVEVAGLQPNAVRVRNPETVVFQIGVGYEMFSAPLIPLEAIGKTRKGSDWQVPPLGVESRIEPSRSKYHLLPLLRASIPLSVI